MFWPWCEIKSDHLGHQGSRFLHLLRICRDSDESVGVGVELLLEADDHDVHAPLLGLDVGGHLADVGVVQGGVNLVQDKEGGGLVRVDGEQQRQGRDGLLSARQVGHGLDNYIIKGWKLKNVPFSFYPWCIQSELSLVKHGQ